jgi:hypothetical protein
MRRIMTIGAVLCCAAVGALLADSGFEGSWTAKVPGPSGQNGLEATFTFHVGDAAAGTVTAHGETYKLVDVKIDGSTVTFAIEGEEQNKYTGKLKGDEIQMQVKYPSSENGTRTWSFVAKRARVE